MTTMTGTLRRMMAWTLMAGVFTGFIGLFAFDGPSSLLAQTDNTAPTISSVTITSDPDDNDSVYRRFFDDDVYGIGETVEATVTFNEDVTVLGAPQLELDIGGTAKNAAYKSTTGAGVVFSYTVASGDNDADGISVGANKLSLNEGSIKDAANKATELTHSALSAQTGHKVDGIRPTIKRAPYFIGSSSGNDGVRTTGEVIWAGVDFTEDVIVIGAQPIIVMPRLKLDVGGSTRYAPFGYAYAGCDEDEEGFTICVSSPRSSDWKGYSLIFKYTVEEGDLDLKGASTGANAFDLNGGTIRDAAGNNALLTHSATADDANVIVDAVPATVESVEITSDPGSDKTYGAGDTIDVTVTFSESVRVPQRLGSGEIRMPLLELNIGGVSKTARTHERGTITGTTVVFSYTVRDGDNDADGISIGANKLTTQANRGITDNYIGCCPGGENADLRHDALADDEEHKVGTSMPESLSTDATLTGLTLSGIDFGTFASDTESYSASVPYRFNQTSVVPIVSHSGARYVTKLGGVTDSDGRISLAVGSNVITIIVTAEDGSTTKTYTVTVTRAAPSTDATLKGLTLNGIDYGTFASGTESYSATVPYSVSQALVHATVNDSRARHVTKIGGVVVRPNGIWTEVPLATGANVITIEVTAEDGTTTYTRPIQLP